MNEWSQVHLPDGNYSRRVTNGYARGFDRAMPGTLHAGRRRIAEALRDAWHRQDVAGLFTEHGFAVETGCPFRFIVARRCDFQSKGELQQ